MKHELPSKKVLEAQVAISNQKLRELAERARIQQPEFEFKEETIDQEFLEMADTTTTAGFWNHFIGGPLSVVQVSFYLEKESPQQEVNKDSVRSIQSRCYRLTKIWQEHSSNPKTEMQQESCEAFLATCTSFDWATNLSLAGELVNIVVNLGDTYIMSEGHLPLRLWTENLRAEGKI